jgi:hypothetical protein
MARRFFPSQDAIGKRIAMEGQNPGQLVNPNPFAISPWIGIVGVVSDIRRLNFEATNLPEAFLSYWQSRVDPVMALRHE